LFIRVLQSWKAHDPLYYIALITSTFSIALTPQSTKTQGLLQVVAAIVLLFPVIKQQLIRVAVLFLDLAETGSATIPFHCGDRCNDALPACLVRVASGAACIPQIETAHLRDAFWAGSGSVDHVTSDTPLRRCADLKIVAEFGPVTCH
jgi:hypothetical protein